MTTTRVFQHYLSAVCEIDGTPAVLGDSSVKLLTVDMKQWGNDGYLSIPADIPIEGFTLGVGVRAVGRRSWRGEGEAGGKGGRGGRSRRKSGVE